MEVEVAGQERTDEKKDAAGPGQICYSVRVLVGLTFECSVDSTASREERPKNRERGGRKSYQRGCRLYFVFPSSYLMGFCQTSVRSFGGLTDSTHTARAMPFSSPLHTLVHIIFKSRP